MDDLLSAAICEAGLEEFLLAPEFVGEEAEKSEIDVATQSVDSISQANALTEFSKVGSENEKNVEILSDGCIILPSCSQLDTPRVNDLLNNITENAPPATIQEQSVEVVEKAELPRDLNLGNAKRTILSQPEHTNKVSDGNMFRLRHSVASAQQQLHSNNVMVS